MRPRRLSLRVPVLACLSWLLLCLPIELAGKSGDFKQLTPEDRMVAIHHAQVWHPTNVASMDIRTGPDGEGAFEPGAMIACDYVNKKLNGRTPKFDCALTPVDEVKVKYGRENGEVYAEVASTRLLWALGFGADAMYPVRVTCRGCPFTPDQKNDYKKPPTTGEVVFDPAAIERKMHGKTMETRPESGWTWAELDLVDERLGGAPRAHRDALKLLAVLLQHSDSKAEQQELLCLDEHPDPAQGCAQTFMMVADLGVTFGRANLFNRNPTGSVNLEKWSEAPIWKDPDRCIADLPKSHTGSMGKANPRISEEGRRFLADLLTQLSDAQLHDLFEVSRFPMRSTDPQRAGTVDEWVTVFKQKRDQIVQRTCPPLEP